MRLHEKIRGGVRARIRDPRSGECAYASVPGVVETRESFGETTLVVDPARLIEACTSLRDEHGFNFLSDIAVTDYRLGRAGRSPSARRRARHPRPRLAGSRTRTGSEAEALLGLVPPAPPRRSGPRASRCGSTTASRSRASGPPPTGSSARPMMGIRFEGHANLVRIPARGLGGTPAPQGLSARRRARPLLGRGLMSVLVHTHLRGNAHPHPVPTILEVDPEKHRLEDILRVNFGPNHPSTHGVLRSSSTSTERPSRASAPSSAYHTGFEKNMEHKSWWKSVTYAPRIDYVSFHANELLYVLAIEKLLGIEVPRRATWARMAMAELNRIHASRLARDVRARARSDFAVLVLLRRPRPDPRPLRDGGRNADAHPLRPGRRHRRGSAARLHERGAEVLRADAELGRRVRGDPRPQRDLARADEGRGPLRRRRARARAVGADAALDRRRLGPPAMPYLAYDEVDFEVPVYGGGDVYDRYRVPWTRCASR